MMLTASFFKAGRKLVSVSRMAFPRSCSCQGDCGIYYACALPGRNHAQKNTSWETTEIRASLFP